MYPAIYQLLFQLNNPYYLSYWKENTGCTLTVSALFFPLESVSELLASFAPGAFFAFGSSAFLTTGFNTLKKYQHMRYNLSSTAYWYASSPNILLLSFHQSTQKIIQKDFLQSIIKEQETWWQSIKVQRQWELLTGGTNWTFSSKSFSNSCPKSSLFCI